MIKHKTPGKGVAKPKRKGKGYGPKSQGGPKFKDVWATVNSRPSWATR